jgi:hypothetical protein
VMQVGMEDDDQYRRIRLRAYWTASAVATFIYLLIVFSLLLVPGVVSAVKLWLLSVSAALLATPLIIGTWKFRSTEAPLTVWPWGPVVGVILMLEFVNCMIQVIAQVLLALRLH